MSELINKEIILEEIFEGESSIKFIGDELYGKGLKLDIYWGGDIEDGYAQVSFDFGMDIKIGYNNWLTKNFTNIEDRIIEIIKFELFQAFFHYQGDPNYNCLNWALYGNLKNRTVWGEK